LAVLLVLAFSRPVRIEYHKWRLRAAKADYERLRSGEYQFTDKARELLLAKPVTWEEVRAAGKLHEQKLVEAGFLHRQEYYARRGEVPTRGDPEFRQVIDQMDQGDPYWSYFVGQSASSLTVTATKDGLQLWEKLAPTIGLQEDKLKKEGTSQGKSRCGRNRGHQRPGLRVTCSHNVTRI